MAQKIEKHIEYAAVILIKLEELFQDDNDSSFDRNELMENDNATEFIHALANLVPNKIYNKLTGDKKNNLEFNHLANHLCFQYHKKE